MNKYQIAAMRTNDGKNHERLLDNLLLGDMMHIDIAELLDGCMGLAGESGELIDMIKKWVFHSKEIDLSHAQKELGDVCWYIALICHAMGWNLDTILEMNIAKLKARYPEGFDTNHANNRKEDDV